MLSSTVQVQGRFLGSKHTEGPTATHQFVADVPLSNGHKFFEAGTLLSGVPTGDFGPVMSDLPIFCTGAGYTLSSVVLCLVATVGLAATHRFVEGGSFLFVLLSACSVVA